MSLIKTSCTYFKQQIEAVSTYFVLGIASDYWYYANKIQRCPQRATTYALPALAIQCNPSF